VAHASLVTTPARTWGTNCRVLSILPVGDRVYVAGTFGKVVDTSGVSYPAKNLAAFSATTGRADLDFAVGTNGTVNTLATDGSTLYVGGMFTSVGNEGADRRRRWRSTIRRARSTSAGIRRRTTAARP
jgi:hypothetical protein